MVRRLLLLGAFLQRAGNRLLHEFGLNQQQFIVLKEIRENGPISQKDICSDLLFEKANVSKIVGKLTADKLINSARSTDDGRFSLLTVTPKGKKLNRKCMANFNQWNINWLKLLSQRELERISENLKRLEDLAR